MKRFISLLFCVFLFLFPQTAFCADSSSGDVYSSIVIPENKISSRTCILEDLDQSIEYIVDQYRIENVIDTRYRDDKTILTDSAVTICEIWREKDRPRAGSGSNSNYSYDQTGSIYFTITLNYTDTTYNNQTYRRMTSVSGSYSIYDTQMSVTSQSYTLAQFGSVMGGGMSNPVNNYSLTASSSSWSNSISSSTYPYIREIDGAFQAARYEYTIRRVNSGTTWSGSLQTNTIGNNM